MADKTTVAGLLADMRKKGVAIGSHSEVTRPVEALTTGNMGVDWSVARIGGLPVGRITELYGLTSSGKTTTAIQTAAALQKDIIKRGTEEYILYLDFEHSMDLKYSQALGLDTEHPSFVLVQPSWLEEGAKIALTLIKTGQVRLSIWDSVAVMEAKDQEEGGFDQRTAAMNRGRLMAGMLRQLNPLLHDNDSAAIFINHLTKEVVISGMPQSGPPKNTSPSSNSLRFYAALRLEYQQVKTNRSNTEDQITGDKVMRAWSTRVKVKAVKNKVGPPFGECEILVRYGRGFDDFWTALQVLISRGVIKNSTGYYYFGSNGSTLVVDDMETSTTGRRYVQGEEKLLKFADEHPLWRDEVIALAREKVQASKNDLVLPSEAEPALQESAETDDPGYPIVDSPDSAAFAARPVTKLMSADELSGLFENES